MICESNMLKLRLAWNQLHYLNNCYDHTTCVYAIGMLDSLAHGTLDHIIEL